MDSSASFTRALWSAGVWAGTAYSLGMLTGANISLYESAIDGGIMGGSSLGSDYIHSFIGWRPTGLTSAAVTGGLFAGAQRAVRGSDAYVSNFVAAAANDYLVEWLNGMMLARQQAMEDYSP